ncbi:type II toxin-antitoxin system HicA family toxin [Thermoanaerobacterium thermosaccharolyticum]|uniref:type II toxin-antitoxin system HicA family toxin n=1 Tax=Thermoanaerobacterium thermosaccharolyticum TaxID=1517 RepID=UPI0027A553DF|nr:type II toxin-antitoxin system HicA family toxin [Thermoanaerobacterium thermosaccharolyticum]
MKCYSSREILKILQQDGWYIVKINGSHHQLKHPVKQGKVTVPHPKNDIPFKTAKSILDQAGLKLE